MMLYYRWFIRDEPIGNEFGLIFKLFLAAHEFMVEVALVVAGVQHLLDTGFVKIG